MMKELLFIVNPNAGRGLYRFVIGEVLKIFHENGYVSKVYFTNGPGDAIQIAKEESGNFPRLVCMGGDGTLSETISGIMASEYRPLLGYIPLGTTNVVASTLKLSNTPSLAARTAVCGTPHFLDIGRFNGSEFFTFNASFGAFTEISYETPQPQKQVLGRLAYIFSGVASLGNLTHRISHIEWDDGSADGDFIFAGLSNSRSMAGLVPLRDITSKDLSDGLFELFIVRNPNNVVETGEVITNAFANKFNGEHIILAKTKKARFTFTELTPWTRDGESGGEHLTVDCENIPNAIQICVD